MTPEKRERILTWAAVAVVAIAVLVGVVVHNVQRQNTINCMATGQDC